ncbi:MAG: 2'-5' RNA ligase [candidate division TM6 bacterium GW2011_GWE2_36_25]|nr:MAG: 2'-5' RNA ligase [candidate division TM6 bacterium GW2011_GWF2_36_131]KKQ03749.1 MAG: 2'-5' RNA ligase [candidate division TM6 bacterium GW2011_GWE2_36_25]KKQ19893.1 MAG: 2'-5' RNA ligase [candidate division TM6 bacterium GW2011_GWA2_36_9]
MRYFIAIDFPEKIIEELLHIQQKVKKANLFDGKFVEAENLHLTLRFLGELDKGCSYGFDRLTTSAQKKTNIKKCAHSDASTALSTKGCAHPDASSTLSTKGCARPELVEGNERNELLDLIQGSLKMIQFKPFTMKLGGLGVFVPERPRVLWVDLIGEEIYSLQKQIEWAVNPFVASEEKPFVSHITLARIKHVYDIHKLMRVIDETSAESLTFSVDKFILKQSELTPDGPIYRDVACYPAKNL